MSEPILGATVKFEGDDSGIEATMNRIAADIAAKSREISEASKIKIETAVDAGSISAVRAEFEALGPIAKQQAKSFKEMADAIEAGAGSASGIKTMQDILRTMPPEIGRIVAGLRDEERAAGAVAAAVGLTTKQIEAQARARAQLANVRATGELNREAIAAANAKAAQDQASINAISQLRKIAQDHLKVVLDTAGATGKLRSNIEQVYAKEVQMASKMSEFDAAIKRASASAAAIKFPTPPDVGGQVAQGVKDAATQMIGFATVAGAAVVAVNGVAAGMKAVVQHTVDAADSAKKLSALAAIEGISVERIQAVAFAAERTGASLVSVKVGISTLERSIEKAAEGSEHYAGALAKIGARAKDFEGLNSFEQFDKVARSIAKLTSQNEKALVTQELFGRGGREVLPLIKEYELLINSAADAGVIIKEEDIVKAKALSNSLTTTSARIKQFFTAVASGTVDLARNIESISGLRLLNLDDEKTQVEILQDRIKALQGEVSSFDGNIKIEFEEGTAEQAKEIEKIIERLKKAKADLSKKEDGGIQAEVDNINKIAQERENAARKEVESQTEKLKEESNAETDKLKQDLRNLEFKKKQEIAGRDAAAGNFIAGRDRSEEINAINDEIVATQALIRTAENAAKAKQASIEAAFLASNRENKEKRDAAVADARAIVSATERAKALKEIEKAIDGIENKAKKPIQIIIEKIEEQGARGKLTDQEIQDAKNKANAADSAIRQAKFEEFLAGKQEKHTEAIIKRTGAIGDLEVAQAKAKAAELGVAFTGDQEAKTRANAVEEASIIEKTKAHEAESKQLESLRQAAIKASGGFVELEVAKARANKVDAEGLAAIHEQAEITQRAQEAHKAEEEAAKKQAELVKKVIEEGKTEEEKRIEKIAEVNSLLRAGLITQEQAKKAQDKLNESIKETVALSNGAQQFSDNQKLLFKQISTPQAKQPAALPIRRPAVVPDVPPGADPIPSIASEVRSAFADFAALQREAIGVLRQIRDGVKAIVIPTPGYT